MDPAQFHVIANEGRWEVERNGATLTSHATRQLAIDAARDQAHAAEPAQVIVHGADGQIEQDVTFGDVRPGD